MKSLRTVRVLRPLRAVSRSAGTKLVLDALIGRSVHAANIDFVDRMWP